MPNTINASSMADIAFLLLIFFLVTTTIDLDKGILQMLPPIENDKPTATLPKRNTMEILVGNNDVVLINGKTGKVADLRQLAKEFIDNNGQNPLLSDSPKRATISLRYNVSSSYGLYIAVQNELKAAYRELRDAYALNSFGHNLDALRKVDQAAATQVVQKYPMRLLEPEPFAEAER